MDAHCPIPTLSREDEALLLALIDPAAAPTATSAPNPIAQARFLARPDIQPLFRALQALREFRAEIERDHRVRQTADLLLEIARTTDSLVEKRRAATAVIRLLFPPRPRAPTPSPATQSAGARSASEEPPPEPQAHPVRTPLARSSTPPTTRDPSPHATRTNEPPAPPHANGVPRPEPGALPRVPDDPRPPSPAKAPQPSPRASRPRDPLFASRRRSSAQCLASAAGSSPRPPPRGS